MSSEEVMIQAEGVGKRYEIYETPRDRLKQFLLPPVRRTFGLAEKQYFREFWALRDVSLEIRRGETVGIVGSNGSGKSTLLQILCGTLAQTTGDVRVNGRVAALLELGAGFNPEFTGRENVFMNAALLGLTSRETEQRLDDILAFADIGDFIDQPVKTYSSGMYVRLAFGVIAHVDADVLVVDEALAVGDTVFTQRCMRFINRFQEQGTLLFVSHDVAAVQGLCRSAVWLKEGQIVRTGPSREVAEAYLHFTQQQIYGDRARIEALDDRGAQAPGADDVPPLVNYGGEIAIQDNLHAARGWKSGGAEIVSIDAYNVDTQDAVLKGWDRVRLVIRARAHVRLEKPILGFIVKDRLGQDIFGENTLPSRSKGIDPAEAGQTVSAEFVFRLPVLQNGDYAVMASVADGELQDNVQHHYLHDACILHVSSSSVRWGLVGAIFEHIELKTYDD